MTLWIVSNSLPSCTAEVWGGHGAHGVTLTLVTGTNRHMLLPFCSKHHHGLGQVSSSHLCVQGLLKTSSGLGFMMELGFFFQESIKVDSWHLT